MPLWAGRTLALVGILLVALNLRTAVTAISPIAAQISADIPLDNLGLSVIGTLPPIAFALAGIFGAPIATRLGLERFLIIAAVAMVVGHLLRALAGDFPLLFLGSVLAFTGMGVGNVLLPPLVKKYFPDRIGVVTAAYVTIMALGATSPAVLAAPVAHAAGWRVSVGVWALVAFLGLLPWIGVAVAEPAGSGGARPGSRPRWRSGADRPAVPHGARHLALPHRVGRRHRVFGDLVQRVFDVRVDA